MTRVDVAVETNVTPAVIRCWARPRDGVITFVYT